MDSEIKHTWQLHHSAAHVWDGLTDSEKITQWLMPNDFKPVLGHKFMFHTKPIPQMNFDGEVYCEVLELVPMKKLVYSWKGGPGDGTFNLDTIVSWTLTPKDGGIEVELIQTGFTEHNQMTYAAMNVGWRDHIGNRLVELLNKVHNEATSH